MSVLNFIKSFGGQPELIFGSIDLNVSVLGIYSKGGYFVSVS